MHHLPERLPGSDVAPCHVHQDNGDAVGMLYDSAIDGQRWTFIERIAVRSEQSRVGSSIAHGTLACVEHCRVQPLELVQVMSSAHEKHAAVPVETTAFNQPSSGLPVGFFDEMIDR